MSTQQIPSVAQIAAARSALWHQNTPEPAAPSEDLAQPGADAKDIAGDQQGEPAAEPQEAEAQHSELQDQGAQRSEAQDAPDAPLSEESAASEEDAAASEHPGIDITDPDATTGDVGPVSKEASQAPASVAIMTQSAARDFINRAGLLLFAARPQFAGVPAPTFVEATLGTANANPSLSASATARTLLARLIADGSAVPLNLLGLPTTTGEAPDFIASAAAFPYIFTLRGDKAWKQPPSTSGPTKVSPLAANTFNLLVENGPKSAYDLATDLGKEVTEAAVLRALSELWQQLRILPVPQNAGKATIWEPITTRFTKQIKTGANAGQPTALSTFISLFLGQSLLATEDEIETFLSPLAPRSRVRDVLHALSGARQLETMTIEGKHHLHISGDLPLFAAAPVDEAQDVAVLAEDGSRIKKFVPKPRKLGTGSGDRPKPFRSPADRSRDDRQPRTGERSAGGSSRPTFNKPWEEEKQARTERAAAAAEGEVSSEFQDVDLDAGTRPAAPRRPAGGSRPGFGSKPGFGGKPSFGGKPGFGRKPAFGGDRPAFNRDRPAGDRPAFNRDRPSFDRGGRDGGGDRFQPRDARRDFTPHAAAGDSRPPRKPFGKPGFGGKPAFGAKPSFPRKPFDPTRSADDRERRPFRRDDASGDSRPPRRPFSDDARGPSAGRPSTFGDKPRFTRGREGDSGSGRPPFRKFDAPRQPREGDAGRPPRRPFDGERSAPRSGGFGAPKPFGARPFVRREGGDAAPRREGFAPREGGSFPRRESGSFPRREGGGAPPRREGGGFTGRREGGFAPGKKPFSSRPVGGGDKPPYKKPFSRSAPDAPGAGTFEKFKGNAKPWGKRPPARKYKPKEDEA